MSKEEDEFQRLLKQAQADAVFEDNPHKIAEAHIRRKQRRQDPEEELVDFGPTTEDRAAELELGYAYHSAKAKKHSAEMERYEKLFTACINALAFEQFGVKRGVKVRRVVVPDPLRKRQIRRDVFRVTRIDRQGSFKAEDRPCVYGRAGEFGAETFLGTGWELFSGSSGDNSV
jgi:hypothetical protein